MGLREKINENPGATTVVAACIVLAAIVFIIYQSTGSEAPPPFPQAYYSVDDGKSWFADDFNKDAPFTKDGQEAVRAYVFQCGEGKPFVGYLEKYSPQALKEVQNHRQTMKLDPPPSLMEEIMPAGILVKKPGAPASEWVSVEGNEAKFDEATTVVCPDDGTPKPLQPQ